MRNRRAEAGREPIRRNPSGFGAFQLFQVNDRSNGGQKKGGNENHLWLCVSLLSRSLPIREVTTAIRTRSSSSPLEKTRRERFLPPFPLSSLVSCAALGFRHSSLDRRGERTASVAHTPSYSFYSSENSVLFRQCG